MNNPMTYPIRAAADIHPPLNPAAQGALDLALRGARDNFHNTRELLPVILVGKVDEQGKLDLAVFGVLFSSLEAKEATGGMIREARRRGDAVVLVSESWMVACRAEHMTKEQVLAEYEKCPPSQRPDRIEVVTVVAHDLMRTVMVAALIKRPAPGQRTLSGWEVWCDSLKDGQLEGRLAG